jgi:hypothetical protein
MAEHEGGSPVESEKLSFPMLSEALEFLPDLSATLLHDEQIINTTKAAVSAMEGKKLDVDSSVLIDSKLIINLKSQLDEDSKNINAKRAPKSLKSALEASVSHLEGTLSEALGEIEKWVHQTEALELSPLPVETVDLVAQHAAEVMEGERLNRRINELNSMIDELRGHLR